MEDQKNRKSCKDIQSQQTKRRQVEAMPFVEKDLTKEQENIVTVVMAGHSVFYTGSAGIATSQIGGVTVGSFVGCGLLKDDLTANVLVTKIKRNNQALSRWKSIKVWIIDKKYADCCQSTGVVMLEDALSPQT
ncbi:hypothetical protein BDR26DRAFT_925236 [Obelidium mucronatum]|nr:hypothetical protein BDR26DRAFT_925235 [Obelidium mucronatum]KAI9325258.1 hypothetical protein BDR26DRAFT_925236 [Obelidium mucronatum]